MAIVEGERVLIRNYKIQDMKSSVVPQRLPMWLRDMRRCADYEIIDCNELGRISNHFLLDRCR